MLALAICELSYTSVVHSYCFYINFEQVLVTSCCASWLSRFPCSMPILCHTPRYRPGNSEVDIPGLHRLTGSAEGIYLTSVQIDHYSIINYVIFFLYCIGQIITFRYSCVRSCREQPAEEEVLTLLHSERPKLYTILAFLSAIGLRQHPAKTSSFKNFVPACSACRIRMGVGLSDDNLFVV